MAIEKSLIAATSVKDNTDVVIEMVGTRPVAGETFSPSRPPGQLVGYFDTANLRVELFVVVPSGLRFARVT